MPEKKESSIIACIVLKQSIVYMVEINKLKHTFINNQDLHIL